MFGPFSLPRSREASFRDLGSSKAEVRAAAVADLVAHARGEMRQEAIAALEGRLSDGDARVRAAAAVALGDLTAQRSVPALIAAADDEDAYVRQMAMNAIGEIGDAQAIPLLRRALRSARPEVRYQAVIAYSRVAEDDADIDQALVLATNDEDDAVAHIALRIAEERLDRGRVLSALLLARARVLLSHESPDVALASAIVLAKAGDSAGHDPVLRVIRGDYGASRPPAKEDECAAVELAGEIDLRASVPHLERRAWGLSSFVRDTCKFHAKIALARMGHPRAVAEIMRDLGSSRRDVLDGAVVAAGRARLVEARGLIERLSPSAADPDLVRQALDALVPRQES